MDLCLWKRQCFEFRKSWTCRHFQGFEMVNFAVTAAAGTAVWLAYLVQEQPSIGVVLEDWQAIHPVSKGLKCFVRNVPRTKRPSIGEVDLTKASCCSAWCSLRCGDLRYSLCDGRISGHLTIKWWPWLLQNDWYRSAIMRLPWRCLIMLCSLFTPSGLFSYQTTSDSSAPFLFG